MKSKIMPKHFERRTFVGQVEVRKDNKDNQVATRISGYAARFYDAKDPATQYELWSGCIERIMPGAFDSAMSRGDDVRCLFNHNPDNILGRTLSDTCKLSVDKKGLFFECDLPDSPIGQTVAAAISRGDVSGCSFAFDVLAATWSEEAADGNEIWYRDITDVQLYDVGPVTYPAYEATDVDMASARSSFAEFQKNQPTPDNVKKRRRRLRLS